MQPGDNINLDCQCRWSKQPLEVSLYSPYLPTYTLRTSSIPQKPGNDLDHENQNKDQK